MQLKKCNLQSYESFYSIRLRNECDLEGRKPTSKQSVKGIWLFLTLPLNSLKLFHTNEVTESDYFSILIARLPETEYWKNGNFLRTLNLVMNMVLVILQVRTIQRFCFSSIQVVLFFVNVFMWKLWFRTTLTKITCWKQ